MKLGSYLRSMLTAVGLATPVTVPLTRAAGKSTDTSNTSTLRLTNNSRQPTPSLRQRQRMPSNHSTTCPFSGKNRAQRDRLHRAFFAMSK